MMRSYPYTYRGGLPPLQGTAELLKVTARAVMEKLLYHDVPSVKRSS